MTLGDKPLTFEVVLLQEPSAIIHPHKDPLFLVIEESGVELREDFLIPVVPKLEQISIPCKSQGSRILLK
jgi:hypothetical protein